MEFRILAMDEPTAALNAAEVARLFAIIERLKRRGVAVLYVSHRLREIFQIADRVTGFRDGKRVDTRRLGELTEDDVVTMMLGRALKKEAPIDRAIPASKNWGVYGRCLRAVGSNEIAARTAGPSRSFLTAELSSASAVMDSGWNVRGPSVWQPHRFHRGLGTSTRPNTVLTGVLPESLVVYRLRQCVQARRCSNSSRAQKLSKNFQRCE